MQEEKNVCEMYLYAKFPLFTVILNHVTFGIISNHIFLMLLKINIFIKHGLPEYTQCHIVTLCSC